MVDLKGSFRVNKLRWAASNTQYSVLFLKDRMVFVKLGGQFADVGIGGVIGGVTFGGIGAGLGHELEEKLRGSSFKKRDEKIKSFSKYSVEELLQIDKKNFEVLYRDVSRIEIKKTLIGGLGGPRIGIFSIEGKKKEKFDIAPNQEFEGCQKTVKNILANKMK